MKVLDRSAILSYGSQSVFFRLSEDGPDYVLDIYAACRETFSAYFNETTKHVGYCHTSAGGKAIAIEMFTKFWREVEEKLHLKPCVIHEIHNGNIVLEVDPWWAVNSTRRSFFTLLLRCGVVYYKGDFDRALETYELARQCKLAVLHFLSGHTTPTYEGTEIVGAKGIVNKFGGVSQEKLNGMLVKIETI